MLVGEREYGVLLFPCEAQFGFEENLGGGYISAASVDRHGIGVKYEDRFVQVPPVCSKQGYN